MERIGWTVDICREFLPSPQLRPFAECIWYSPAVAETRFDIVPDGCVDACFVLSERAPRALLFGTTTRTSAYELESGAPYFGVRFRPGSASLFVREKISDLTDTAVAVPGLLGLSAQEMLEAASMTERRNRLEAELIRALGHSWDRRPTALGRAISIIDSKQGNVRMRELGAECNLSERQLERLFLERVGITPKLYMRIRRFRSVLSHLEDPPDESPVRFADIAASYGYADQSHLARDFRDFSHRLAATA